MQQHDERVALVALLLRTRSGWSKIVESTIEAGSVWTVLRDTLGIGDTLFEPPDDPLGTALADARELLEKCESQGIGASVFWEADYPAALREIHEMPPIVFTRGRPSDDRRAIAVVGSRNASPRGREIAGSIAGILADERVTVVSGLAAGIDTAAHTAALGKGGRTVAVIGTGTNRCYPRENRRLQDEIAEHGMVVSQFLPDAAPTRHGFPMRNAVMSGYAAATIVVEAGEHSGARIQARFALKHGRPVIFPQELLVNQWARDMAERPGVHVVAGMDELMSVVHDVLAETEVTAEELVASAEAEEFAW